MSLPEVGYHLRQQLSTQAQRLGLGGAGRATEPELTAAGEPFLAPDACISSDRYSPAADRILTGRLRIFDLETSCKGTPVWNRDPKTGKLAPLSFGKALDYRNVAVVGDIKYLWEPNRHLHLVIVAQAYRLTGGTHYLAGLRTLLDAWFEQCPYPRGPNWTSSLELAIRLINWSIIWQLIGGLTSEAFEGPEGQAFRERWLTCIYRHMHFVRGNLSRYSSANNHLIGELAGLYLGASTWPFWRKAQTWGMEAKKELLREALLQNAPDGVNREQAISYQQFVLDFLLLAGLAARARGDDFPVEYWKRLESMLEFTASIMDVAGNMPMIGDADDGYVVRLSQEPDFCPYRSLLATGAVLFQRGDFKYKAGRFDDKSRWLLGGSGEEQFRRLKGAALPRRVFPDGGYYILGCGFDTDKEVRIVVDAGPLGYLSIAAHGHADALAFTLSLGGHEILIDPGTYAYHTERVWRDYFRGTVAHNTLCVDGEDQSVHGGPFMWIRHARATCLAWESTDQADRFVGAHDGYQRLRDPTTHERQMIFDKKLKRLQIADTLRCAGTHKAERYWHFAEHVDVTLAPDGTIDAKVGRHRLRLRPEGASLQSKVYRGKTSPPRGWVSRRFGVKVPTITVVWATQVNGTTEMRAVLDCAISGDKEDHEQAGSNTPTL